MIHRRPGIDLEVLCVSSWRMMEMRDRGRGDPVDTQALIIYQLALKRFHIFSINTAEPARVTWLDALLTTPGGRGEHFSFIVEEAELKEVKQCFCCPPTSRGQRGGDPRAHPARETPKHGLCALADSRRRPRGQAQVYPAPQRLV